jgi:hypothetical protein
MLLEHNDTPFEIAPRPVMRGRKEGVLVSEDTKKANYGAFGRGPFNGQIANATRWLIVSLVLADVKG